MNTNFWQILMIFVLLDLNYTAWFDHPGLLNLGHFRPIFFIKWWIYLIQINRCILPPRTPDVRWVMWKSVKQLFGRSAILSIFSGFLIGQPTISKSTQTHAPLSTCFSSIATRPHRRRWVSFVSSSKITTPNFFSLKMEENWPMPAASWKNWMKFAQNSQSETWKMSVMIRFSSNNYFQRLNFWLDN